MLIIAEPSWSREKVDDKRKKETQEATLSQTNAEQPQIGKNKTVQDPWKHNQSHYFVAVDRWEATKLNSKYCTKMHTEKYYSQTNKLMKKMSQHAVF